jgi:hypothetical protein
VLDFILANPEEGSFETPEEKRCRLIGTVQRRCKSLLAGEGRKRHLLLQGHPAPPANFLPGFLPVVTSRLHDEAAKLFAFLIESKDRGGR